VRRLAGNGADAALRARIKNPQQNRLAGKRRVPSPLTHRSPKRWRDMGQSNRVASGVFSANLP